MISIKSPSIHEYNPILVMARLSFSIISRTAKSYFPGTCTKQEVSENFEPRMQSYVHSVKGSFSYYALDNSLIFPCYFRDFSS